MHQAIILTLRILVFLSLLLFEGVRPHSSSAKNRESIATYEGAPGAAASSQVGNEGTQSKERSFSPKGLVSAMEWSGNLPSAMRSLWIARISALLKGRLTPRHWRSRSDELSELIISQAEKYRIHPALLLAFIRVESNFNAAAVSPSGALGLMQLLKSTAKIIVDRQGWENAAREASALIRPKASPSLATALREPRFNLELGTEYLSQLKTRYPGEPFFAIAAYNVGERVVDRLAKNPKLRPVQTLKFYSAVERFYWRFANVLSD